MAEAPPAAAAAPAPVPAPRSKLLLIVIVSTVLLAGGGAGAYFMLSDKGKDEVAADGKKSGKAAPAKPKGPAIYVKLDPPFVSNFESKGVMRFLQVTVEVMSRDAATTEVVKQNDPMIRNDLLLLFSSTEFGDITSPEGKEKLRKAALEVVRKVVSAEGGDGTKVEQLFFTSFVMQ